MSAWAFKRKRAADIAPLFGFLAIIAEFCGDLGLIVGLLGRVASFGIFVNMIVAVAMVHSRVGFL